MALNDMSAVLSGVFAAHESAADLKVFLQVPEFNESSQPKPDFESYLNKVWLSTTMVVRVVHSPLSSCFTTCIQSWQRLCCCFHPTHGTVSSIGRALTM